MEEASPDLYGFRQQQQIVAGTPSGSSLHDAQPPGQQASTTSQHLSTQVAAALRRELGAQEVELDQIQRREGPALKMLAAIEGSKEEQPDKMVVARLRAVVLRAKEGRATIADMRKKVERVLPKQVLYAQLMALHDAVGLRHDGVSWVQVEGVVAAGGGGESTEGGESGEESGEGETDEGEEDEEGETDGEEDLEVW